MVIHVEVSMLSGKVIVKDDFNSDDTVASVKSFVKERHGCLVKQQELLLGGSQVHNSRHLREMGPTQNGKLCFGLVLQPWTVHDYFQELAAGSQRDRALLEECVIKAMVSIEMERLQEQLRWHSHERVRWHRHHHCLYGPGDLEYDQEQVQLMAADIEGLETRVRTDRDLIDDWITMVVNNWDSITRVEGSVFMLVVQQLERSSPPAH